MLKFAIGLARILSKSKKSFDKIEPPLPIFAPAVTMPTATKTKLPNAGSKRKAEVAKDVSAKGSKKPKIDRPRSKAVVPKPIKHNGRSVQTPIEQVSSDDGFDGFDEDGGVELDHDDADNSNVTPEKEQFHGVHPERVKAAGNGAGPNGKDMFSVYIAAITNLLPRYFF